MSARRRLAVGAGGGSEVRLPSPSLCCSVLLYVRPVPCCLVFCFDLCTPTPCKMSKYQQLTMRHIYAIQIYLVSVHIQDSCAARSETCLKRNLLKGNIFKLLFRKPFLKTLSCNQKLSKVYAGFLRIRNPFS